MPFSLAKACHSVSDSLTIGLFVLLKYPKICNLFIIYLYSELKAKALALSTMFCFVGFFLHLGKANKGCMLEIFTRVAHHPSNCRVVGNQLSDGLETPKHHLDELIYYSDYTM